MKNKLNTYALNLILLAVLSLTFAGATQAQSTDMDSPTELTSNVITGEGDGTAETFYYSFTATKGDVKVTVDAKTDYYSTLFKVTLMDEDGKELLPIYIVAIDTGQREVKTKHFVRDTKVIVRIALEKNAHVKLLTYKIKLDGAVKIVEPTPVATPTPETSSAMPPTEQTQQPAEPSATPSSPENQTPAAANPGDTKPKTKDKVKKKAKKTAKKILDGILDD
jgi:cell division septation protein DedD